MKALPFFLLLATFVNAQALQKKAILPDTIYEASGLYIESGEQLWWLNDSGNAAELYVTDGAGILKDVVPLKTENKDWEDLTADDEGNLYIGEFGNNRNKRKKLKILIYNPEKKTLDSIRFKYPDQTAFPPQNRAFWNFNMEGFFWFQDELHLFSKNEVGAGNFYTKHYILSDEAGKQTAQLVDSIYLKNRVVTAAAISPDSSTVALLAYNYGTHLGFLPFSKVSIFLLTDFEGTNFSEGKLIERKVRFPNLVTQYECLDFVDNETVIIASEKTLFYKQRFKQVSLEKALKKKRTRP